MHHLGALVLREGEGAPYFVIASEAKQSRIVRVQLVWIASSLRSSQ